MVGGVLSVKVANLTENRGKTPPLTVWGSVPAGVGGKWQTNEKCMEETLEMREPWRTYQLPGR